MLITDERQQRLIKVKVDDNTRVLDARDAEQLTLKKTASSKNWQLHVTRATHWFTRPVK